MRRGGRCALNIRAGESIEQFAFRHSDTANRVEIVYAVRCFVIKQTIPAAESVRAQLSSEVVDFALVVVACFLRSANVRARTHPASIGVDQASIAVALKNCRRRGDISQQSRHEEKQSREQSDQSARALKLDYVGPRSARVGGAPCLAAAACCTDPRSESV
jgi:hypothetical protein